MAREFPHSSFSCLWWRGVRTVCVEFFNEFDFDFLFPLITPKFQFNFPINT